MGIWGRRPHAVLSGVAKGGMVADKP